MTTPNERKNSSPETESSQIEWITPKILRMKALDTQGKAGFRSETQTTGGLQIGSS